MTAAASNEGFEPVAHLARIDPEGADAQALQAMEKRAATCTARAAIAGVSLHRLADDAGRPEWIATRWALTRAFHSLDDVEAWLARVEGRAA